MAVEHRGGGHSCSLSGDSLGELQVMLGTEGGRRCGASTRWQQAKSVELLGHLLQHYASKWLLNTSTGSAIHLVGVCPCSATQAALVSPSSPSGNGTKSLSTRKASCQPPLKRHLPLGATLRSVLHLMTLIPLCNTFPQSIQPTPISVLLSHAFGAHVLCYGALPLQLSSPFAPLPAPLSSSL